MKICWPHYTKDRFLWQNTGFGMCDIKFLHNDQTILLSYAWRECEKLVFDLLWLNSYNLLIYVNTWFYELDKSISAADLVDIFSSGL